MFSNKDKGCSFEEARNNDRDGGCVQTNTSQKINREKRLERESNTVSKL